MRILRRNAGQFVPISALIMFSVVMLMVATVSVYKVSRAKLQVQNLADAAALNLASQQAQAFNKMSDDNEWLNHMTAGIKSPNDESAPELIRNCHAFANAYPLHVVPPVSCVENRANPNSNAAQMGYIFHARGDATSGAIAYGLLVHSINVAQVLFARAYNSFLGVPGGTGSASSTSSPTSFVQMLKKDIPALDKPGIHLVAWNSANNESRAKSEIESFAKDPNMSNTVRPIMEPLKFVVDHDLAVLYYTSDNKVNPSSLGSLLYGTIGYNPGSGISRRGPLYGQPCTVEPCRSFPPPVGWMKPDMNSMPRISIQKGPTGSLHVGVGVLVSKSVSLGPVLGTKTVVARAKAYIVNSSGDNFHPTYWVKLAN